LTAQKGRPGTVFVVSPDADERAQLEREIRKRGYGVVPLATGLGAIAGARQGVLPCAIVFVVSAEDDCADFLRLRRADPALAARPMIMVSLGDRSPQVSEEAAAVLAHFVEIHCTSTDTR